MQSVTAAGFMISARDLLAPAAASTMRRKRNASGLAASVSAVSAAKTTRRRRASATSAVSASASPSPYGNAAETTEEAATRAKNRGAHTVDSPQVWRVTSVKAA